MKIANRQIGAGYPAFVVAEVGINHDGSLPQALLMVRKAARCGVDAVKFGVFKADEFCSKSDPLYSTFKSCELPDDAWAKIKQECVAEDVLFFATPQNESDLNILLKVGVPCIKVGSDDLTNLTLIDDYCQHGLPIILSTGMADLRDVYAAVDMVCETGNDLLVCVCTSEYPCPPESANLARITTLRDTFRGIPIGFSDHTIGPQAASVAAALGAAYFETHFTLDNSLVGPDHHFSKNPAQLANWVWAITGTNVLLGSGEIVPTKSELLHRPKWRRASGQQIRGVT